MIKYFHTTVPHSGTRYINGAVERATGLRVVQTPTFNKWEQAGKPEFVFAHVGAKWIDFVEHGIENSEKPWMTIRSPIHTWGTQWKNMEKVLYRGKFGWQEKLGQLREQYETQMMLLEKYPDLYVHPVESDLKGLGEYLGLDLPTDNNTFSRNSPMKAALREKDVEQINKLCHDTDFFECFRDSITPDIKDFYEGYGYDIWWI